MSKEIPILFSAPMVKALLDDRKFQTRRIIKSNDESGLFAVSRRVSDGQITGIQSLDWDERNCEKDVICRYGKPGDRLYVRENWRLKGWHFEDGEARIEYQNGEKGQYDLPNGDDKAYEWLVKQFENLCAAGIIEPGADEEDPFEWIEGAKHPFKPSIHLPKWCSRIWLEVESVRVERLQNISEEDAIAEGVQENICEDPSKCPSSVCKKGCCGKGEYFNYSMGFENFDSEPTYSAVESFQTLWEFINGRESWVANPWVWVISFKVLSTGGKPE